MHLINVYTFRLQTFCSAPPGYAILSHVWRKDGGREIEYGQLKAVTENVNCTFISNQTDYDDHIMSRFRQLGLDFDKIFGACLHARWGSLQYLWVDTCCIDKSNSSELSEAINSMYSWYGWAQVCFVYLEDVKSRPNGIDRSEFWASRWFKRAWTLQELIAPFHVSFFDRYWVGIGDKGSLKMMLSDITRIEPEFLMKQKHIANASVAKRMSWAAGREATRIEDVAYSLMGIFDVNMPLIYGEGEKAFIRLQEEILKETDDHSIFAWKQGSYNNDLANNNLITLCQIERCENPTCELSEPGNPNYLDKRVRGIFADSPSRFAGSGFVKSFALAKADNGHIMTTNRGIYMPNMLSHVQMGQRKVPVLLLNCKDENQRRIAIFLHREAGDQYTRAWPNKFTTCAPDDSDAKIYLLKTLSTFRAIPGNQITSARHIFTEVRAWSIFPDPENAVKLCKRI